MSEDVLTIEDLASGDWRAEDPNALAHRTIARDAQIVVASLRGPDRELLAQNPNLDPDAELILATGSYPVRYWLALNPSIQRSTFALLAAVPNDEVRGALYSNANCPSLGEFPPDFARSVDPEAYERFAQMADAETFHALADNWEGSVQTLVEACRLVIRSG